MALIPGSGALPGPSTPQDVLQMLDDLLEDVRLLMAFVYPRHEVDEERAHLAPHRGGPLPGSKRRQSRADIRSVTSLVKKLT
jgi:hypothetical protein